MHGIVHGATSAERDECQGHVFSSDGCNRIHETHVFGAECAVSHHNSRVVEAVFFFTTVGLTVGNYCGSKARLSVAASGPEGRDGVGARTGRHAAVPSNKPRLVTPAPVDMASALLRRQLAHKITLPRRCLFSSTSSVLAQAAPQQDQSSSSTTTAAPGGKNAFSRHIAEDLQGVSASEVLAESGTRKDAQMRHFTGEGYGRFFVLPGDPLD